MAKYIIYTYQFSPIRNSSDSLFKELNVDALNSMTRKQDIFESILLGENTHFSLKKKEYGHKIIYKKDHIIVLKLANTKTVNLEEDFQKHKQNHYPSCQVIIDNRHDVQHIAIEESSAAFADTQTVCEIIKFTFRRYLKLHKLYIDIQKEFQHSEFWNTIKQYPSGITMVRFHFLYPNLPRVWKEINKLISNASKTTNSKQTTFEFKAEEDENLELLESSDILQGLVMASADSGSQITLKARQIRRLIKTGNTSKSIVIDDLELLLHPDMFDKNGDFKLIEKLNKIK